MKELFERLEQTSSRIDKLIWIAASYQTSELMEMVEDFSSNWEDVFPDVPAENIPNSTEELHDLIFNYNKLGLIAQVLYPMLTGFRYDDKGEVVSCSIHEGNCIVHYDYAESLEELVEKIEKRSIEHKEYCVKKEKNIT